jgi:thiamine pyrophosphokinase
MSKGKRIGRGIVFIGGEGPPPDLCRSILGEALREGEILTAAADSGLLAAEAAGLRPDWVLGDMDSLGDLSRLDSYPPERVLRYGVEKDYTDTELALRLLWERGCDELWILGGGGGRLDHLLALRSLFERDPCPSRWITGKEDLHCLGAPAEFRPALFPGALVSVFPLGEGPWEAESAGLRWPLGGLPWDRGFFGLSNVAEGPAAGIRVRRGRFLVLLPLVREVRGPFHPARREAAG